MERPQLLLIANAIAEAISRKYSVTTGFQYTEESVGLDALTLTIMQVLRDNID